MPTWAQRSLTNPGPHGFSEILYAFTSGAGNNGSAFAGLSTNWWYNIAMGWDMLIGRFLMMIPVLALAGNLAQKKSVPPSPGTFPVNTPLFTVLLVGVVLIIGALTFFPALSLGPILEHLLLQTGKVTLSNRSRNSHQDEAKRTVMAEKTSLWNTQIMAQAPLDCVRKLDPRWMVKNPVMFVVEVGSVLTTALLIDNYRPSPLRRSASTCRSRSGCGSRCCSPTLPKPWPRAAARRRPTRCARPRARPSPSATRPTAALKKSSAELLRAGDVIYVEAGHYIAGDGEVIEGVASVDESAITGESAPVIREAGGDRSAVTGGTKVLVGLDQGARSPPIPARHFSIA